VYYPGICVDELRRATKGLHGDSLFRCRDFAFDFQYRQLLSARWCWFIYYMIKFWIN